MARAVISLLLGAWLAGADPPLPPLSRAVVGTAAEYDAAAGDTLESLAARYGVDPATIARRHGLARGVRLRASQILHIPAIHIVPVSDVPLVVNVPQRMVFVVSAAEVRAFPVAVGRPTWPTPRGDFTVTVKEEAPTWDVPVSIQEEMRRKGETPVTQVPPSPANPLGAYWIGLSLAGIGLHGTNAPQSIYRVTTHGCVRVHPDRIRELFDAVDVGMRGRIIYEPLLLAVVDERVFVEVHRDAYGRVAPTFARLRAMAAQDGLTERIDWVLADAALTLREGVAVDVSRSPTSGAVQQFRDASARW
jgi:L,D-transpeptidase ErfK/SrfK